MGDTFWDVKPFILTQATTTATCVATFTSNPANYVMFAVDNGAAYIKWNINNARDFGVSYLKLRSGEGYETPAGVVVNSLYAKGRTNASYTIRGEGWWC